MKEGWTYKKLGEVCIDFIVPQRDKPTAFDGNIPWCRIEDIEGRYLNRSKSGQNVTKELADKMNMHICPKGTVISACSASIGNQAITTIDCYTNQTFIGLVVNPVLLNNVYLYYFLSSKTNDLQKMGQGVTIKYISKNEYKKMLIPLPSIENQQRIVAELDLLNGVVEKRKAQLVELDNLTQSIFYDMFGDPVTNEKGWEIKKIGEIGKVERGAGISKKDFVEDGIPCIHYGQLHTCLGATTHVHKTCIPNNLLPKFKIAHPGDVIMAITSEDVEGSCTSTAWLGDYDIIVGSDAAIFHHNINGVYISYYTRTKAFYNEKAKYAKGFKVTHISTSEIESIPIPLPPLSLQQEFAAKVEAIEAMKAKVRQSLKEAETLFNSRMDYYFN